MPCHHQKCPNSHASGSLSAPPELQLYFCTWSCLLLKLLGCWLKSCQSHTRAQGSGVCTTHWTPWRGARRDVWGFPSIISFHCLRGFWWWGCPLLQPKSSCCWPRSSFSMKSWDFLSFHSFCACLWQCLQLPQAEAAPPAPAAWCLFKAPQVQLLALRSPNEIKLSLPIIRWALSFLCSN